MTTLKEGLINHRFPKQIAELMHSNQFLKGFSILALLVALAAAATSILVGTKQPIVLTLSPSGQEQAASSELPKPELQVEQAVRRYIDLRYKWEPSNVQKKLGMASAFIHETSQKAFQGAIANVIRFSTEKQVTQRAYPEMVKVNLTNKTVQISGDRITAIQGIMAAGPLKIELSFESGQRTKENPWGIYITKEKESL